MTTVISSSNSNDNDNDKVIEFRMVKRDPSGYPYVPNRYEDIFFREIIGSNGKVLDYQKVTKEEANRIRKKKNQRIKIINNTN